MLERYSVDKLYFKRQIELWGEERQSLLVKKTILIVGCGGLGSNLGLTLGASGVGKIVLIDFDSVEKHNIHRQIAYELKDCGKPKAEVLKSRIEARFEDVIVESMICDFRDATNKLENTPVDLILDATDNLETRAIIDSFAKKIATPWIYCSVEEFMMQVCLFKESGFNSFAQKKHKPGGIAAPIVSLAASIEANIALRYLVGLETQSDKLMYIYFDEAGAFEVRKFSF